MGLNHTLRETAPPASPGMPGKSEVSRGGERAKSDEESRQVIGKFFFGRWQGMLTLRPRQSCASFGADLGGDRGISPVLPGAIGEGTGTAGGGAAGDRAPAHPQPADRGGGEDQALCPQWKREGEKPAALQRGASAAYTGSTRQPMGTTVDTFWEHHFPGDAAHRDRNHRVAEAVALCMSAGVEVLPYDLPRLQRGGDPQSHTGCSQSVPGPGHQEGFPW